MGTCLCSFHWPPLATSPLKMTSCCLPVVSLVLDYRWEVGMRGGGWDIVCFKPHFFLHSQLFFLCGCYLCIWLKCCHTHGKWFLVETYSFCLAFVYRKIEVWLVLWWGQSILPVRIYSHKLHTPHTPILRTTLFLVMRQPFSIYVFCVPLTFLWSQWTHPLRDNTNISSC